MLSDRVETNGSWGMGPSMGEGGAAQNSNEALDGGGQSGGSHNERCDLLHRRLKRIVKARGSLDLQEAEALREAQRMGMWRRFGYASLVNYMEMELGYSPRTAMERLRVANALPQLPQIAAAIEQGDLTFSGAKELTRVATPETETIWLGATKEMNTREVEQVVSGHRPGDVPTDPVDPKLQLRTLRFEVTGEVHALERQAKLAFRKIRGAWPSDSELLEAAFRAFIAGDAESPAGEPTKVGPKVTVEGADAARDAAGDEAGDEAGDHAADDVGDAGDETCGAITFATRRPSRRVVAPYQVAVTVCSACKRGWQDGAGEVIEMSPAAVERALCDCQYVGSLDGNDVQRSHQAIPPAVRLKVMRRAHGKCEVPGCRSVTNIDVHHLKFRKHGGTNALDNLAAACEAHHLAAHDGTLVVDRVDGELRFVNEGRNAFTRATRAIDAARALRERGVDRSRVREAIERTRAHVGATDLSLDQWVAIAERYLAV